MRYLICSAKQSRANQFSLSRLINIQQVGPLRLRSPPALRLCCPHVQGMAVLQPYFASKNVFRDDKSPLDGFRKLVSDV